jgi:hypothetical protein
MSTYLVQYSIMAWTSYNSFTGDCPLFGEAGQETEDLKYDQEFIGNPSSALVENIPPFFTGYSFYDSLIQCPQPD